MRAFGVTFDETILAWEDNSRFAFRVDKAAMPTVKAFADEWRFDGVGTQRTRIGWTSHRQARERRRYDRNVVTALARSGALEVCSNMGD